MPLPSMSESSRARLSVSLEPEIAEWLRNRAQREKRSVSAQLNWIVCRYRDEVEGDRAKD